jgi:hypothetical protein
MISQKTLGRLAGSFLAVALASKYLSIYPDSLGNILNDKEEYENLSKLETENIDLDKKLNIKRLINEKGELNDMFQT